MLPGISTMKGTRCRVNFNYSSSTLSPYYAGYTCAELPGPGNGTLLYKNQIVYSVAGAKCGESVEVTLTWQLEVDNKIIGSLIL